MRTGTDRLSSVRRRLVAGGRDDGKGLEPGPVTGIGSPAHGRDPRLVPVPGVGLDDGKGDTMAAVSLGPPSGSGGPQPAQRRRCLHR